MGGYSDGRYGDSPGQDPGGPALDRAKGSRASGQATAEAAKAKANGKGKALGHAKQAEKTKGSTSQGTPGGSRPEFAGTQGPPPHASSQGSGSAQGSTNGQSAAKSQSSGAETNAPAKGVEASQGKAGKSAKSAK